jgi:hypothetical protein
MSRGIFQGYHGLVDLPCSGYLPEKATLLTVRTPSRVINTDVSNRYVSQEKVRRVAGVSPLHPKKTSHGEFAILRGQAGLGD